MQKRCEVGDANKEAQWGVWQRVQRCHYGALIRWAWAWWSLDLRTVGVRGGCNECYRRGCGMGLLWKGKWFEDSTSIFTKPVLQVTIHESSPLIEIMMYPNPMAMRTCWATVFGKKNYFWYTGKINDTFRELIHGLPHPT